MNETEYYKILKELKDNTLAYTIDGRPLSEEEFIKEMKRIIEEAEEHADTI